MQFGTLAFWVNSARMGLRRVMQLSIERLMVFMLNISFSPYKVEYEQNIAKGTTDLRVEFYLPN